MFETGAEVDFIELSHDGTDASVTVFNGLDLNFVGASVGYKFDESVYITEKTAANADFAGLGQFWVRDDAPNTPMFTDDTGVDYELNKVVQSSFVQDGAVATGTTLIPFDDTIPQITEGDEYLTLSHTPLDAANLLYIFVYVGAANSAAGQNQMTMALFKDAVADALSCSTLRTLGDTLSPNSLNHRIVAGGTSAITFRVRAGLDAAGTTTFNGESGARLFGGVLASSITILEVTP